MLFFHVCGTRSICCLNTWNASPHACLCSTLSISCLLLCCCVPWLWHLVHVLPYVLTGSRMKHPENIAKIPKFDRILFVFKECVWRHTERLHAIFCLTNCSIVFQVELDWFTSTLQLKVPICRGLSGDVVLWYPQKRHVDLGDIWIASLWARCYCGATPWRLSAKWTTVWRCPRWPTCAKLRRLFKWSPLQFNVNRNKLPGDSLKSNCSGKIVTQVTSATDRELFPDSCWMTKEPGNDVPRDIIRTRGVIELLLYELKIKIPAIYSRLFLLCFLSDI